MSFMPASSNRLCHPLFKSAYGLPVTGFSKTYRLPFQVRLSLRKSLRSDPLIGIRRIFLFLASWAVTVMKFCSRLTLPHSRLWISAFRIPVLRATKITCFKGGSAFVTSNQISLLDKIRSLDSSFTRSRVMVLKLIPYH